MDESASVTPSNGEKLIVDGADPECYSVPSAAFREAGEHDRIEIRPGVYDDKLVVTDHPIRLFGAGRDLVQIFYRRGGPLYL
jgi:pectin methylesterase-like acyl-CoA thioesterase